MRKVWIIVSLLALVFVSGSWIGCSPDSSENSDCQEFNPPAKTQYYGQDCGSFMYGTCPNVWDDCAQGACLSTSSSSGSVCTKTCSTNADCQSGIPNCVANYSGTKVCTPSCTSHTYCDGYMCCSYYPDPANPTVCKQGTCYAQPLGSIVGSVPLMSLPVGSVGMMSVDTGSASEQGR